MKRLLFILSFAFLTVNAQEDVNPLKSNNPVIQSMIDEAVNNSQLENLAHELFDVVGPRLVGTPQMQNAHDWARELGQLGFFDP